MKIKSQAGGVLLATLSFIILLAVAAASILELTMNSYKLTMRNEMRAQARAVAESELENVYFQWVTRVMSAVPASQTPAALAGMCDVGDLPVTAQPAFLTLHRTQGWVVRRSINFDPTYDYIDGVIPNTSKRGQVTYITVRIEVLPNATSLFRNELSVRVGRRFASSNSTIFQYGIFYQGDLEMAPGSPMMVNGDVAANGSIYMGAGSGATLTLNRAVRYLSGGYFNQDSLGNTVLRKPGTPVGGALSAPVFGTSQAAQLEVLTEPENLLGGVDATEMVLVRPDLFPVENDVYRSAILPPPSATDEYPTADSTLGDDPSINVSRMYTRAGLRVTVNTDNTVTITTQDGNDVTAQYPGVVVGAANSAMYDQREAKNVYVTTIDLGALVAATQANYAPGSSDFNGVLYFNVRNSNSTTPRAIKLTNATNLTARAGNGISVATNGGVYVKGSYNTASTHLADGSTNPAMIMADAVTALSDGWVDSNSALDLAHRPASTDIVIDAGILTGNTPATSTNPSGGAQNLLRYLEDWAGRTVTVNGSLGRLFQAKTFNAPFQQPGLVYGIPDHRNFVFDSSLLAHPPAGSPSMTAFTRGSFFVW